MKQIFYVSFIRFPGEKAHALYVAKTMEAFSGKVDDVRVVVPRRYGVLQENFKTFYDLKHDVLLVRLPCIDLLWLPVFKSVSHKVGLFTFALSAYVYAQVKGKGETFIFSNDALVALFLSYTKVKVIYEIHDYPEGRWWFYKLLGRRVHRIQTNNEQKVRKVIKDFKVPQEKVYFVYNGVTVEDFDIQISQEEAQKQLGLDVAKKYVVYTGHLYEWKGARVLAQAAKYIPDIQVLIVGGTKSDVVKLSKTFEGLANLHFVGHRPHREIPLYLKAADVLVLPNSATSDLSMYHTSPMKLIEYIASKRPIVASDIPSVREVLNDDNATLVPPDNPKLLSDGISSALNDQCGQTKLGIDAQQFSWENRANSIIRNL